MRYFLILISFFYLSCKTTDYNSLLRKEIQEYKLENVDTLVDIGCGDAFFDKVIFNTHPHLFLILEDLPVLEIRTKKWKPHKFKIYNTKDKIHQHFKNSDRFPAIEKHFQVVLGSADSIPLGSDTYSRILCRRTLHEFKKREKMISELTRILKKDGILTIVEVVPKYHGQKDPYCMNSYLTKQEIIEMFYNLTLKSESIVTYPEGSMSIMSFTK